MADIFISWGKPDAHIVQPIAARLRQFGFDVVEYSEDMAAGENIPDWIRGSIDKAQIAMVFLSANTTTREWIRTEVGWCYDRFRANRIQIVPVIIGDVPHQDLPHLIKDGNFRFYNMPAEGPAEASIFKLVEGLRKLLGNAAPIIVPAALLAMTLEQFDELVKDSTAQDNLSPLCAAVGMEGFPSLAQALRERYGRTAQDFSPFPGERLTETVQKTLESANKARIKNKRPPVWVRWCTDDFFDKDLKVRHEARERCLSSGLMLILDSISLLHPVVRETFFKLPAPRNSYRSALLWVPPYTRHTAKLAKITEDTVESLGSLLDKFHSWQSASAEPYIAFDIGTSATLGRWLYRAFGDLVPDSQPLDDHVAEMRQQFSDFKSGPPEFFTMRSPRL